MFTYRKTLESPQTAGRSNQSNLKEISSEYSLKDWCWSWSSSTLATSWKELTHWKRPWCSEGLRAGGEGDDRGWDGCMASPTRWTWVWVNSGSWWWTGRAGVLQFMGSQRVGHDLATELNWYTSVSVSYCCVTSCLGEKHHLFSFRFCDSAVWVFWSHGFPYGPVANFRLARCCCWGQGRGPKTRTQCTRSHEVCHKTGLFSLFATFC